MWLAKARNARRCSVLKGACVLAATAIIAGYMGLSSAPAFAESLIDAFADAYRYNPQLDAQRAALRATDEDVNQAYGTMRPKVTLQADAGRQNLEIETPAALQRQVGGQGGKTSPRGYSIQLIQPLFRGFQTINAVNETEAQVRAGRESLRNVEQEVLLNVATQYGNVVRDQAIVRLRENNIKVLQKELKANQDRFAVGEITRTDVAQSQASLAQGKSDFDLAKANLNSSRAQYEQFVGHAPGTLVEPRSESKLVPRTLQEAITISSQENPSVVAALYNEQAARFNIDKIRGELLPEAQLEATFSERKEPSTSISESETTSVVGRVTVPIYEQGIVYSRVRQAKHTHISRIQAIEQQRAAAQAGVVQGWSLLTSARAQIESDKAQIEANRTALSGVREEEKVGQRTVNEVLNAQQTLLNSEVQIEITKRNLLVGAYTVISAIGRLNVAEVGAASTVYNPEAHYNDSVGKWYGLDITHDDSGRNEHFDAHPASDRHTPKK